MKFHKKKPLDIIFKALFTPYKTRVKDVKKISEAMIKNGMITNEEDIVNDHIAFRSLGLPNLGINSLEKIFLHYGYEKKDHYYFEQKKLDAYWYSPPHDNYPRIFLSELRIGDLSERAQSIIKNYTKNIISDPTDALDLNDPLVVGSFFEKPLWNLPSLADYKTLQLESEYAAWVIYNRYYLNHYTISIHELPEPYKTLEGFNTFLETIDIVLNTAGGVIKTSKDGLLKQSSTVSQMIDAEFAQGEKIKIAGSYVEFAERLPLSDFQNIAPNNLKRHHRRDGFEAANADKIFESTYSEQTKKNNQ